jgi:hypothetical protein
MKEESTVFDLNLDEVDKDGAIREAAENLGGDTRFDFLRKSAIGGGALLSGGALLAAFAPSAMAAGVPPSKEFGTGPDAILKFALTLEYLESTFYNQAYKNMYTKMNKMQKQFITTVKADEAAHVAFLQKALGKGYPSSPKFDFKDKVTNLDAFLATSYVLENTGVHAYLGQAPNLLKVPAVLVDAASIVTIEARHAGAIALLTGKEIAPNGPFDTPLSGTAVFNAVVATGFVTKL